MIIEFVTVQANLIHLSKYSASPPPAWPTIVVFFNFTILNVQLASRFCGILLKTGSLVL